MKREFDKLIYSVFTFSSPLKVPSEIAKRNNRRKGGENTSELVRRLYVFMALGLFIAAITVSVIAIFVMGLDFSKVLIAAVPTTVAALILFVKGATQARLAYRVDANEASIANDPFSAGSGRK